MAAAALGAGGWSAGASINLVDLREQRMANVETHLDAHASHEVPTAAAANYSHMNMYKELAARQYVDPSTAHRQARIDALHPARTADDARAILSDTADAAWPIFRGETLASLVLDGATGRLRVWCCGTPAARGAPVHTWELDRFFDGDAADGEH